MPTPTLPGLSVVLPCLGEPPHVVAAVRRAAAAAARTSDDHEIIVVADGCGGDVLTDVTRLVGGSGRVRLLVHPEGLGYGAALRTGIAAARMPWVLLVDPDLEFDARDLEDFALLSG